MICPNATASNNSRHARRATGQGLHIAVKMSDAHPLTGILARDQDRQAVTTPFFSLSPTFPVVRMMGPSNLIGSALGFFTFAQFPDRPDLNDGPSRFGTMPSQPGAGLLEINAPIALIMLVHNDARGGSVQEVCQ